MMLDRKQHNISFEIVPSIVREFIKALGRAQTYDIRRNGYLIFGMLWGIPVPVVAVGAGLYYGNLVPSVNNIINVVVASPIQFFFLVHPLLFGVVFGAMGTVRYDKERQRLEFEESLLRTNEKLKSTNKKLQELDELKDNFLSMVSHELWTPLTTVQGYVSFLAEEKAGSLTTEQKDLLEITEEQVDNLSHLIGDLVDISKIETGKFEVKLDRLNMGEVTSRVLNSMKRTAEEKDIILKNDLSSRIHYVLADEKRIIQVLTNLVGNAIKFMPEGGKVSFAAVEKGNKVVFSVIDSGIGIHRDEISKIFDKFYQVDSSSMRKYSGCGLGLAIAKSIIELHGGRIWVKSQPGEGSDFSFELEKFHEENYGKVENKKRR